MHEPQLIKAFSLGIQGLPDEIQWMPPGMHDITPSRNGKPISLKVEVNQAAAQAVKESLAALKAEGKRPYLDFNHDGGKASALVDEIYWAGDDPKLGGIRAKLTWTKSGQEAVEGKDYQFFSPSFFVDPKTNRITGAPVNFGGLVNEPAFTKIMPLVAKNEHQNKGTMKGLLTTLLTAGLITSVDQEEDALVADFQKNFSPIQAAAAEADTLKADFSKAQEQIKAHAIERAKTLVNQAVQAGKLPPKDTDTHQFFINAIAGGDAGAEKTLAALPVNAKLAEAVKVEAKKETPDGDQAVAAKQCAAVDAIRAGNPKLTHDQAWDRAALENPELFSK